MASLTSASVLGSNKISKTRGKTVKPILKKTSHSEKNSLDLDRGWEDTIHYGNHGWGGGAGGQNGGGTGGTGGGPKAAVYESGGRSARDVSFSLSATDLNNGGNSSSGGGGLGSTRRYGHTRSTSGTSHASVATSASGHGHGHGHGHRNGSFIHPFQQTPRASTPPLSYANSLTSFDVSNSRDYSPTITEDDDDVDPHNYQHRYHPSASATHQGYSAQPYSSSMRRPSLASQRTNSNSDLTSPPPPLRVNTSHRSSTAPVARLTSSRSDLRLDAISSSLDSPASSIQTAAGPQNLVSPPVQSPSSSSVAPSLSPIRSSLEMNFRLRSRSEVDTAVRQAQIRAARRQFEDKEAQKEARRDEKAARKRDAEVEREAQKIVRKQKAIAKAAGLSSGRNSLSLSTDARPSYSRKNTSNTAHTANTACTEPEATNNNEKIAFSSNGYDAMAQGATPTADAVHFETTPRRMHTAKRKTASAWTSFILWLRTKLLKAGRR